MGISALVVCLIIFLSKINGSLQLCDESEFTCNDGHCVDHFLVCDGRKHCPDGSDETWAECSTTSIRCPSYAFRCAYGACIDLKFKCDGNPDCADSSDEAPMECGNDKLPGISTWIDVPGNISNPEQNCPSGKFACDSKQCINDFLLCDGEVNCNDGSDETRARCQNFPCPPIVGFQCAYGGCIDKDKRCDNQKNCADGSDEDRCFQITTQIPTTQETPSSTELSRTEGSCILPEQLIGGFYNIKGCDASNTRPNDCRGQPGTPVNKFTLIVLECYNGYRLETNQTKAVCIDGEWSPPIPKCLKLCPPLKSSSLTITCDYKGTHVDCGSPVLPGTIANMKCKAYYRYRGSDTITVTSVCNNDGVWTENLFQCKPECGLTNKNIVTPLISKGKATSSVEYPWHSALYRFDPKLNDYEMFCGGSIISPYMILTAAHCFEGMIDLAKIMVIVGKTNRSFQIHDPDEQRIQVSKLFMHSDYTGSRNWYAFDLAILELKKDIEISKTAMPICLETIPPWSMLEDGTPGTAVGFGANEHGELSDRLMVANMPYLNPVSCIKQETQVFRSFITHDKFCAFYVNGSGVQQGDSGGGLAFQNKDSNLYFIRGIVSIKIKGSNKYVIFTNVSEKTHQNFIRETQIKLSLKH